MTTGSDWHKPRPKQLTRPSYAPALMALGLTGLLWGVVTSWIVSAIGLVVTGTAAALWIEDFGPRQTAARATRAGRGQPTTAKRQRAHQTIATPWLHRTAVLLAAASLLLVLSGAGVTSKAGRLWEIGHVAIGVAVAALTIVVAVLLRNRFGWTLVAAVLALALLGTSNPAVAALHAFLAHLFFAATVAAAFVTSKTWKRHPEPVEGLSPLRTMSTVTVGLVVVQVALGAAVRHKVIGAGLHITFAMVVALAIVILGVMVTNRCPTHRTLRPTAVAMMVIAGAQVFLGFGAFIIRLMAAETSLAVQIATMAHVTTGALTLASTVLLALEIRRSRRPSVTASTDAVLP